MLNTHIRAIRQAEAKVLRAVDAAIDRQNNFSILELINARMSRPALSTNTKALDATLAVERACFEAHGEAANGAWVPFNALSRDLQAAGSPLITNKVSTTVEDALRPVSALIGAGATVITGIRAGNLIIPALDSPTDVSATWISGEGANYPQGEPTFRQVTIEPHTLAVEVRYSRRLLKNATADMEDTIRRDILTGIMRELDRVALVGTAANKQPDGLLTRADIPLIHGGDNGAVPTWATLADMEYTVASGNGRIDRGGFLTNPKVARKLRATPRHNDGGADFILGSDRNLLGYPTVISTVVPHDLDKGTSAGVCSAILFGDFSELIVGFWGPAAVDLIVDDKTMAVQQIVRLVARVDVGIAPRHLAAFAVAKDVITG